MSEIEGLIADAYLTFAAGGHGLAFDKLATALRAEHAARLEAEMESVDTFTVLKATQAALAQAKGRERELAGGLKPFADAARSSDYPDADDSCHAWESDMAMAVTHGDFRRAAALIQPAPGRKKP